MSIITIRNKITTAVVEWATGKGVTVARERVPFTKPTDQGTFVELNIIPADTIVATVDGQRKRYVGNVICNIWVKDGEGTFTAEHLADELVALFPVFPKIYAPVSIETVPSIKRTILDDSGYAITPVTFEYRMEA